MAYESGRLKRVGTEELRYGVYELRLNEDEAKQLADNSADFITTLLKEEGAPDPNEVVFEPSAAADWIDDLIKTMKPKTPSPAPAPAPPDPPQGLVFHQESGAAVSRYIVIVLT